MPIDNKAEQLSFDDSVKVNDSGRPILGRLKGVCADFINPTRNGRKYSQELWEKVFNSPIIKEYFECGGIFGELDHPADRDEVCSEKIAICMPKPPEKDSSGHLVSVFDILDTPCGKIAYTLAKYGYKLGISSRGNGDLYIDEKGEEAVDPDTYQLNAFDLVLLPSVKAARLELLNESLNNDKSLKKALKEALESSDETSRKIMTETLDNLKIDYTNNPQETEVENIDANQTDGAASDIGADVLNELQETLAEKARLEAQILELNEKLSVCYAKEIEQKAMMEKYTRSIVNLSESAKQAKALEVKVSKLSEQLEKQSTRIQEQDSEIRTLRESRKKMMVSAKSLQESVSTKDKNAAQLNSSIKRLEESLASQKASSDAEIQKLNESIQELKTNSQIKNTEYATKLKKANELVEKYKTTARAAVDKYIGMQAKYLGVSPTEIRNRLKENYSFNDIDSVCQGLKEYQLNINTLPFSVGSNKVKMQLKESASPTQPASNPADVVDAQLLKLAGIN